LKKCPLWLAYKTNYTMDIIKIEDHVVFPFGITIQVIKKVKYFAKDMKWSVLVLGIAYGTHDEHIRNIIGRLLETQWEHGTWMQKSPKENLKAPFSPPTPKKWTHLFAGWALSLHYAKNVILWLVLYEYKWISD
jgi:hypothetical protein